MPIKMTLTDYFLCWSIVIYILSVNETLKLNVELPSYFTVEW